MIELHAEGKSYRQIANETGISKDAAREIIKYCTTTGELNPPSRPGKPPVLSERDIRHLVRLSDSHPRATLAELAQEASLDIKPRTVGKYLRQANRFVFLARRKPWLGRECRKRRKRWCRERRKWEKEAFQKLVYTDEVRIQVSSGTSWRRMVRRRPGPKFAYKAENLQPTFIGEPISVGFWAAFSYGNHTPLIPLRKRGEDERKSEKDRLGFDSKQYVHEILIPHLLPFYERCGGLEEAIETIEDGASYHTSDYTRRYRLQYGIKRMDWPSHSPDLNPIENVWAFFKRRYRRTVWERRRIPRDEKELIALAQEVWEGLPWRHIYTYIDSMPQRIVSCLRNNGGPTRW